MRSAADAAAGRLTSARAEEMEKDFADLTLLRHPMLPLMPRVLELRHHVTTYAAFYVALAELLDEPLLTSDQKFAGAAGHHAVIEAWR